jgi:hypothetical protein
VDVLALAGPALPVPSDGLFLLGVLAAGGAAADANRKVRRSLDPVDEIGPQRLADGSVYLGPAGPDPDVVVTDMKRA